MEISKLTELLNNYQLGVVVAVRPHSTDSKRVEVLVHQLLHDKDSNKLLTPVEQAMMLSSGINCLINLYENKDDQKTAFDFILESIINEFENVNNYSDIKVIETPIEIKKEDKEIEKI